MRLQKTISVISGVISLIALVIAIFLHFCIKTTNSDFCVSILTGVFSSGILVFGVGIISYFSERNKLIKELFESAFDFTFFINTFEMGEMTDRQLEIMLLKITNFHRTNIYFIECELSYINHKSKLFKLIVEQCTATHLLNNRILGDYKYLTQEIYFSKQPDLIKLKEHTFFVDDENLKEYIDNIHNARENLGKYMHYYEKDIKQ